MLARVAEVVNPPQGDPDVKTLFVSNVDSRIQESDLRDHFYYFGEITSIKLIPSQKCAFIEFATRDAGMYSYSVNFII